jgi:hypothetical protein
MYGHHASSTAAFPLILLTRQIRSGKVFQDRIPVIASVFWIWMLDDMMSIDTNTQIEC